jgi:hypothetical protein
MAMRPTKGKDPKKFLAELATNPELLGKFIKAPVKVMTQAGIDKKHMRDIKNAVAHSVHNKLASAPQPFTMVVL